MASFVNMREAPELEWRGFFSSIEHLHANSHVAYCFFFSSFSLFSKGWQGRLREVFTLATCPECLREVFTQGSFISLFSFSL
jgi:hypothetical protein